MTLTAPPHRALPVNPHSLAQRLEHQLRKRKPREPTPVLLVGAAPTWPHDSILAVGDLMRVRVVPCRSVLAIWEQLATVRDLPTVILTDLPEEKLGIGILSRVYRRRVLDMEPWTVIAEAFGAQQLDPRLKELPWAGRALIDATPPGGWPKLTGIVLQRDTALRHLAVERLRLGALGVNAEDLDPAVLLRWSAQPVARQALDALSEVERAGLLAWLADEFGPALRVLAALYTAGHVADALPLGLVCQALWAADDPDSLRAQGRVDQYLGGVHLDSDTIVSYAAAASQTMAGLLAAAAGRERSAALGAAPRPAGGDNDRHQLGYAVLDRAEELLLGFAATGAARHSDLLRSGFVHRLDEAAAALRHAVAASGSRGSGGPVASGGDAGGVPAALAAAGRAVARLADHQLAAHHPHRVERAEMALRLARWLAEPVEPPLTVADGIARQVAQWAWVDLALGHVWLGEDAHSALAATYRLIHDRVQERRRALDRAFAGHLAAWTAGGGTAGDLLTVETVLRRVVAPVVRDDNRPVLVVVVDGMTADIAADLAEQLARQGWLEYDPLAGRSGHGTHPRRRGVVAALPTVTSVSRVSLLAGELRAGGQSEEQAAFERNPLWRGRPAKLFHKGTIQGEAGEVLSDGLIRALSDPRTVVGVVVNTVDDSLQHGRESADAGWRIEHLGVLRALLDYARYQGRAVILTSDHGHVPERDSLPCPAAEPASARHRSDASPAGEGEVELTGDRVVAEGGRVVALWDPRGRYLPRRAGYHGGASLAEVTVPLLALLPLGAAAPPNWRLLGPQQPGWWSSAIPSPDHGAGAVGPETQAAATGAAMSASATRTARRSSSRAGNGTRQSPPAGADAALFEWPAEPSPAAAPNPPTGPEHLVEQLLASEMFAAQHALTPRKVPTSKIAGALTALVAANGVLPAPLVAEKAGEQPARAIGFLTTLQRILNVDNFAVLSLIDAGRTARLDVELLRRQFDLPEHRS